MVSFNFQADPNAEVFDGGDFPLIADGDYSATIVDAMVKESKSNPANSYLNLEFEVEPKGKVWHSLNLWNQNDKAVSIAKQQLNQICTAVNLLQMTDTDQIVGKRLSITIAIEPAQGEWKAKNKITNFQSLQKTVQPSSNVTTHQEPAAPISSPTAPQDSAPWK
tara:strand:- start:5418 stop:5909 length:492 start_codon:yes stop_codon:yes gene_type:complete